jgi:hypothetical protein
MSTAFLAVAIASMSAPAFAQQIPQLPPVPYVRPPEQTMPVFELIAPTVFPACGTASLGVFLVRSEVVDADIDQTIDDNVDGLGLPPAIAEQLKTQLKAAVPESVKEYPRGAQVITVTTPLTVICSAVPRPPQELNCLFDVQFAQIVGTVTGQAGAQVPLGLHPEGDLVEQTIVVQDKFPAPVADLGLAQTAAQTLVCAVAAGSVPGGDYSQPPAPPPYVPPPSAPVAYPPQIPSAPTYQAQVLLPSNTAPLPPRAAPVGDAVIYGAVWLLPLAMLFFGGYAGGSLTKEIKLSA